MTFNNPMNLRQIVNKLNLSDLLIHYWHNLFYNQGWIQDLSEGGARFISEQKNHGFRNQTFFF